MVKVFVAEFNKIPLELFNNETDALKDAAALTPPGDSRREQIRRAGRLVLRYGLKHVWHREPGTLNITYNPYGKPYLIGAPQVFFNLSHSGAWIVCAIGDREMGIDVEQVRDICGMPAIVARMFSPGEQRLIMDLEGFEGLDKFFSLWTLKESFVKYLGRGFSLPFHTFSILERAGEYQVTEAGRENHCYFQSWDKPPGYKIALCCNERVSEEVLVILKEDVWTDVD